MAAPEVLSGAGQVMNLLDDLAHQIEGLPEEHRLPIEENLKKVRAWAGQALESGAIQHERVSENEKRGQVSEVKFARLFDQAVFAAALSRMPDGVLVEVNEAWVKTFGYTRAEAIGKTTLDLNIHPDTQVRQAVLDNLCRGESARGVEAVLRTKSGEERMFSVNVTLLEIDGEQYILNTTQDLTDQKRAEASLRLNEAQLRTSEEKFSRVFRTSPIALTISAIEDGRFLEVNQGYVDLYGFSRDELIGHSTIELGILSPEDRQEMIRRFRAGNGFRNYEIKGHAKSGEVRYTLFSTEPIELDGQTAMLSVIMDITERKLTESFDRALHEISQILHGSLKFDQVLTRSIAAAASALGCDTAALSMRVDGHWRVRSVFGFPEDILGMELNDDQERHAVLAIQTRQPVAVSDAFNDERFDREHLRKWGVRSVLVMPVIVKSEAIGVIYFNYQQSVCEFKPAHIDFVRHLAATLSLALDNARLYQNLEEEIEERRRVEASLRSNEMQLRRSEAKEREAAWKERARANELQAVMDATPAIIWISRDPECREMTGNAFSYDFLSIRHGENVSKTAPEPALAAQRYYMEKDGRMVPPDKLPIQVAASTGEPARDYTADIVYQDGTRFNLIGNVNPLMGEDGKPYGAIGVFTDVTALRRLEAEQVQAQTSIEVQRRLMDQREQERQAIARDLHDGPIQTLSSTIFHLHMIRQTFPDPTLEVELNQVGMDIKNTIHELREVLNELRPPALMHFGFSRILQMYTEDLSERYPDIKIELDVVDDARRLTDQARLALFRIYQEGINNIVRHSGASQAWVAYRIEEDRFYLELRDNGQGFELPNDYAQLVRDGHFGLVGMRERAEAIGGQFAVASQPDQGTKIVVSGPV